MSDKEPFNIIDATVDVSVSISYKNGTGLKF